MLDELQRVGAVEQQGDSVSLLHRGYVPHQSESALLDIFSISATDLLTTLEHNLHGNGRRRLQMSVAYDDVTTEGRDEFRTLSAAEGMNLLRKLDKALSQHDRGANPDARGAGRHRVGLGLYWIEDSRAGADEAAECTAAERDERS
jgi:hypothetical protein